MIRQEDVKILFKEEQALKYDRKDYLKFHEELSSKDREITILFQDQPIFDVLVPKGVFNPYGGIAAQAFMSGILNKIIDAKGKRVLDLGCGCGVIGLCCLFKDSNKVVFSDLHPNIMPLKNNLLIREQDEVKVQDLCVEEKDQSYDLVFMSFPSRSIDRQMEADSYEIG
ncbi:hypothetical protein AFK68_11640, partial [Hydrocoleum sp. CS-953]|uniref:methyltransferase n=2 Tax=Oscillatoriales TaxID=1150 RepID=UPI000BC5E758